MARRGFLEKILYGIWNNWPSFPTDRLVVLVMINGVSGAWMSF